MTLFINSMKKYWITFASLLGLLAACTAPAQNPVPTPYPPEYLPTVIALTANAASTSAAETANASIPTDLPTATLEPTITPTALPTGTPTPYPGHDIGTIQFLSPGPMSKLVSPIQLHMMVIVGENQNEQVQIDLFGEDGRLLERELRKAIVTTKGAFMSVKLTFETRAAAELGRITITTFDSRGEIRAINSLRVLLLSQGVNTITTPGNPSEPVKMFRPLAGDSVFGGVVNFKGDVWPFNLKPLVIELVDSAGRSLTQRIVTVDHLNPQTINTTLPYKVKEPTPARLVVRQDDDRMPGVFYVYTQEVLLAP
jgi:hypothetical protein